jgi:hypothetical protein
VASGGFGLLPTFSLLLPVAIFVGGTRFFISNRFRANVVKALDCSGGRHTPIEVTAGFP